MGERKIIVSGVVLLVFGVGKAYLKKQPIDVPVIGGLVFMLLLSLLAVFGPDLAEFAGNLAILALITVLLVTGPDVLAALPTSKKGA